MVFSLSLRGPRVPWCLLKVQGMPIARQPVHGGVRLLEQRTLRTLQASQARLVKFEVGEEECDMTNIMDFEVKIEKRLKSRNESGSEEPENCRLPKDDTSPSNAGAVLRGMLPENRSLIENH